MELEMVRRNCLDCVRKHIAAALTLLVEAHTPGIDGKTYAYPHHRWLAVGHLEQAEEECLYSHPKLASEIRVERLKVMQSFEASKQAALEDLIIKACIAAGEDADLVFDPMNSKTIPTPVLVASV